MIRLRLLTLALFVTVGLTLSGCGGSATTPSGVGSPDDMKKKMIDMQNKMMPQNMKDKMLKQGASDTNKPAGEGDRGN